MASEQKKTRQDKFWYYLQVSFSVLGIAVVVDHIFMLGIFGYVLILNSSYLYALLTIYLSLVFIVYPAKIGRQRSHVPWYDVLCFLYIIVVTIILIAHGYKILQGSWQFAAPLWASLMAMVLLALILEATRRVTGWILPSICLFFLSYPMFASHLPGLLKGQQFSVLHTVGFHIFSEQSVLGIPMNVVGNLVVGFIIFGTFLMITGGGKFFYTFALSLFGHQRGGLAKVAVFASGLFGSMSGSAVSNVVTTGSVTIPNMKKTGYSPSYAGAIEACASTGGLIMPPIMGTTAFIIPLFLHITYLEVVVAAIIPATLYYLALFFQVDGYAGKRGMKGLERSELPSVKGALKDGWPYVLAFITLIYLLLLRLESRAPFYATMVLLICNILNKKTRLRLEGFLQFFTETGKVLAHLVAILAAVGLIMGSFTVTGVGHSLSRELVQLAGGRAWLLLIFGAVTCYSLGMAMTVTADYIFLAILLAPALEALGFNVLAVHLFILYYAIISNITPPVAITAFVAAGLAKSPPFKTGFLAMRLGIVLYLVPFFFIFKPALVLQTPLLESVVPIITAVIGIYLLAGGLEGFLTGFEELLGLKLRILLCIGGVLMLIPEWKSDVLAVCLVVTLILYLMRRRKLRK